MSNERSRSFPVVVLALGLVAALGSLGRAAEEPAREWSAGYGTAPTKAKFLRQDSGRAVLQRADGVVVEIPLARLSLPDRIYIADRAQAAHLALAPLVTPNAADSQIPVLYSFDDSEHQVLVGTVFHEDDRFRYLATDAIQTYFGQALPSALSTRIVFTAVVGGDAAPRRVPLEKVSMSGNRFILAAKKQDLPPPLAVAATTAAPQRGDRLRIVGYELRGDKQGMDFARVTSEVVCSAVYYTGADQALGYDFETARPLMAASGVILDAKGNAVALASGRPSEVNHLDGVLKAALPITSYYGHAPNFADLLAPSLIAIQRQTDFGLGGRDLQLQTVDLGSSLDGKKFRLLYADGGPMGMGMMSSHIQLNDGVWVNQAQLGGFELELKPAPAAASDAKFPASLPLKEWPRVRNWTATLPEPAPPRNDQPDPTPRIPGMALSAPASSPSRQQRDLLYQPVLVGPDGKYVPIRGLRGRLMPGLEMR